MYVCMYVMLQSPVLILTVAVHCPVGPVHSPCICDALRPPSLKSGHCCPTLLCHLAGDTNGGALLWMVRWQSTLRMFICLSVCLSVCVCVCAHLYVCLSVSIHLSVYLCVCVSIHLSLSLCLSVPNYWETS